MGTADWNPTLGWNNAGNGGANDGPLDLATVTAVMRGPGLLALTEQYRRAGGDKQKQFPAVTVAGRYPDRRIADLAPADGHTGLYQLDLDHVGAASAPGMRNALAGWPHCAVAFISPGGAGVKGFLRATPAADLRGQRYIWEAVTGAAVEWLASQGWPAARNANDTMVSGRNGLCFIPGDAGAAGAGPATAEYAVAVPAAAERAAPVKDTGRAAGRSGRAAAVDWPAERLAEIGAAAQGVRNKVLTANVGYFARRESWPAAEAYGIERWYADAQLAGEAAGELPGRVAATIRRQQEWGRANPVASDASEGAAGPATAPDGGLRAVAATEAELAAIDAVLAGQTERMQAAIKERKADRLRAAAAALAGAFPSAGPVASADQAGGPAPAAGPPPPEPAPAPAEQADGAGTTAGADGAAVGPAGYATGDATLTGAAAAANCECAGWEPDCPARRTARAARLLAAEHLTVAELLLTGAPLPLAPPTLRRAATDVWLASLTACPGAPGGYPQTVGAVVDLADRLATAPLAEHCGRPEPAPAPAGGAAVSDADLDAILAGVAPAAPAPAPATLFDLAGAL